MNILNRNEIRRLEKAAREKDKKHLVAWAQQLESQIINILKTGMEKEYADEVQNSIDNLLIATAYALLYSEENYIEKENLGEFMTDLFVTIDMFRTGEYRPEDYLQEFDKDGVQLTMYDNDRVYKKYLDIFDTDLVRFLKKKSRKLITIIGNPKYKDIILEKQTELTLQGHIVITEGMLSEDELLDEQRSVINNVTKDSILISDAIYVINKDGYLSIATKNKIKFAEEHNKEVMYLEDIPNSL